MRKVVGILVVTILMLSLSLANSVGAQNRPKKTSNYRVEERGDKGYINFNKKSAEFSVLPEPKSGSALMFGMITPKTLVKILNKNIQGDKYEVLDLLNGKPCLAFGKIIVTGQGEGQQIYWLELNIFVLPTP